MPSSYVKGSEDAVTIKVGQHVCGAHFEHIIMHHQGRARLLMVSASVLQELKVLSVQPRWLMDKRWMETKMACLVMDGAFVVLVPCRMIGTTREKCWHACLAIVSLLNNMVVVAVARDIISREYRWAI